MFVREEIDKQMTYRLNSLIDEIVQNMENLGQVVTGRTADSLHIVKPSPTVYEVRGMFPFQRTETGREAGRIPRGFYGIIRQWAIDKGLFEDSIDDMADLNRFAYFVKRKIANEGDWKRRHGCKNGATQYDGQKADVYSSVVKDYLPKIEADLVKYANSLIRTKLETCKLHF